MSDTSERVGAVDGDKLKEMLLEIKLSLPTVTALLNACALKPEASQETKWEKLKSRLEVWQLTARKLAVRPNGSYDSGQEDAYKAVIELIDELEDAE